MMQASLSNPFDRVPSNRELLSRYVATRDNAAFATLVERFGPMVLGVARRLLTDFEDADDAAQLAFAELAHRAGTIENPDGLASWLHTVTAHIALRLRKRRPGHAALSSDPVDPRLSLDHIAKRSDFEVLSEELDRLPHDWREPLLLRYFSGLSNEETAVQLGTSVTAIEGRLKRGKQSLRARLLRRGVSAAAVLATVGPARYAHAAGEHALDADHWSSMTDAARDVATDPSNLSFVPTLETTTMTTPLITFKAAVATGVAAVVLATLSGDGHEQVLTHRSGAISTVAAAEPGLKPSANLMLAEASGNDSLALDDSTQGFTDKATAADEPDATGLVSPTTVRGAFDVVDGSVVASEPAVEFNATKTPDTNTVRDNSVESILKSDVAVQFVDTPLFDLLDFLEDQHGLQINVDVKGLGEFGLTGDEPFTLVGRYSTLAHCLDVVLQDKIGDLDFVAREDEILITTVERAESIHLLRAYPLPAEIETQAVLQSIESHTRIGSSRTGRFNGSLSLINEGQSNELLLVTTSYRGHREVAELIDLLKTATLAAGTSSISPAGGINLPTTPAGSEGPSIDPPLPGVRVDVPVDPTRAGTAPPAAVAGPGMSPDPMVTPPTRVAAQEGTSIVAYDLAKVSKLLYEPKTNDAGLEDYGSDGPGGGYGVESEYGGDYGGYDAGMGGMSFGTRTRLITLDELGQFSGTSFQTEMVVQRGSQLLVRTDAAMHEKIRKAIDDLVKLLETAGPPEVSGETRITIPPKDDSLKGVDFDGGYPGGGYPGSGAGYPGN